jgi:hypothetical protein
VSPADFQIWLSIASGLTSLGTLVYVFVTAGSRDNSVAIKKVDDRVLDLEQRTARIETDIRHLPSKDGVQRMEVTLAEMNGKIAVLSERLQPVAAISERLQEFMLERAK